MSVQNLHFSDLKHSISWEPSKLGSLFTSSADWWISIEEETFNVFDGVITHRGNVTELESLQVIPGFFWSTIKVPLQQCQTLLLKGIPNKAARDLYRLLSESIIVVRKQQRIEQLLNELPLVLDEIVKWHDKTSEAIKTQLNTKGWLTHEFKAKIQQTKPVHLSEILSNEIAVEFINSQPKPKQQAVKLWQLDFVGFANSLNELQVEKEIESNREFFNTVEKSPLTEEQKKAVLCFESRVLLIAAAGSGKTSTMVAKAGYALKKGYFSPDKILLLAFNNDAANELRERIKTRITPLGLDADKIVANTFHAFGLDVIGQSTGKRPSIAPWVENNKDIDTLIEIVDELKDTDIQFRFQWDLFRIVIGQDLPEFGKDSDSADSWDDANKRNGFRTLNNEIVKSQGEVLVANWLFYNGVKYEYERPYKVDTADTSHRQYHPDFYLPEIDAYLEHWALDAHGTPPKEFVGYKESMEWKRAIHKLYKTTLLETTTAGIWSGEAFNHLSSELAKLGITLDPNPDREAPGKKPINNPRLAKTFRTFLTHVKSNRLGIKTLRDSLNLLSLGPFTFRHSVFLNLFEKILHAWEAKLSGNGYIDFEDMLNLATDIVVEKRWSSPFELIMVDELQDVSHARASLISALTNQPNRYLFAVGDDWQSINRFAGADLRVMTHFEDLFGKASTLKLERTFRCPQSLCDISSGFVQKNPNQIQKRVSSAKKNIANPIQIISVDSEEKIYSAVANRLNEIANTTIPNKKISILLLGRYNHERNYMPTSKDSRLSVQFLTVHSSKGLEADHVIIPKVTSDLLGFPSRVEDDPVLKLAMPEESLYPHSEERRLFYVGLTRAKETVTLITVNGRESPFIIEMIEEYKIPLLSLDGVSETAKVCPKCKQGIMKAKSGKKGPFWGCSRYPKCDKTLKISNEKTHNTLRCSSSLISHKQI